MDLRCKELGQELAFHELINGSGGEAVKDRIRSAGTDAALDLGCGHATALFLLYHIFGFTRLEGVDSDPEERLIDWVRKPTDPIYPDRFTMFTSSWWPSDDDVIKECLTRTQFDASFSLVQEMAQYYHYPAQRYNLIILSDLLHYLDAFECQSVCHRVVEHLRENGVIYVRFKKDPGGLRWKEGFGYEECAQMCRALLTVKGMVEYRRAADAAEEHCIFTNL